MTEETTILERFEGIIERIEGDNVHVTLYDSHGRRAFATIDRQKLGAVWCREDESFTYVVTKQGREVCSEFTHLPKHVLSDEEMAEIDRHVRELCENWKEEDDY